MFALAVALWLLYFTAWGATPGPLAWQVRDWPRLLAKVVLKQLGAEARGGVLPWLTSWQREQALLRLPAVRWLYGYVRLTGPCQSVGWALA